MSLRGSDLFLAFGLVTIQGSGYSFFQKSPAQSGEIRQCVLMSLSHPVRPTPPGTLPRLGIGPDLSPLRVLWLLGILASWPAWFLSTLSSTEPICRDGATQPVGGVH